MVRLSLILSLLASSASAAILPATPAAIMTVMASAKGGDTVQMVGVFPAVIGMKARTFAPPLTIDASAATISGGFSFSSVAGITFHGGVYTAPIGILIYDAHSIRIEAATFQGATGYGVRIPSGADIHIVGSNFANDRDGIAITDVINFEIADNIFTRMGSDGVNIGASWHGLVTRNFCQGTSAVAGAHPDCVQIVPIAGYVPPSDISVNFNLWSGVTQGGFQADHGRGGADRLVFDHNKAVVGDPNAIAVSDCRNCKITNNMVGTWSGALYQATIKADAGSVGLTRCGNTVQPYGGKSGTIDPPCK